MENDPPTVGQLREHGVTHMTVWCHNFDCRHQTTFSLDDLHVGDETVFIRLKPRFRCSKCGEKDVAIQPVWPDWKPSMKSTEA